MNKKLFNSILLCVFTSILSWSQNPFYYKIDKSKGLPSNNVYDIFQDSKGFMWFATDQGICKFDGKNFISYSNSFQNSKAGSNIKEDSYGRIWYSNFDGNLFYVKEEKLYSLNNKNTIGFVKFGILKNQLLVLQKNYIIVYNLKDLKIIKKIPIKTDELITTHCSKNQFYLICKNLILIDKNLDVKKIIIPNELAQKFPATIIQDIPNGLIFVSKYAKHFYTLKNNKLSKKNIIGKFNFIQNLAFDGNYNWICTTQGAIMYKKQSIDINNTYFWDFNISYVFKDKQQNYWFSTISEGILLVPNISNNFIPFEKKPNVMSISNNQLFIGTTNDNIYKTNLNDFKFINVFNGGTNHEVYFLSSDNLLKKILFTSNSFKVLNTQSQNISEDIIALKDAQKIDQKYYTFAASGICGFLQLSNKKSNWDEYISKYKSLKNKESNIIGIIENVQGKSATYNPFNQTVYFATSSGLFSLTRFKKNELKWKNKTLFFSRIKNYHDYVLGITTNETIYKIDKNNQISLFITSKLTNGEKTTKFKIIDDNLFLFTPYSIYLYDFKTKLSKKIIALNPEFEISDVVKNGTKIILANNRGFIILDESLNSTINHPKFIINSIEVNGKKTKNEELKKLKYYQNNININFSILSFIPNQKNRLYYKINNENWQLLEDDSRNFKLNSLSPGHYKIHFQTEFENKKSAVSYLIINIEKPFWLTYSFISIVIIFCLSVIVWIFKWQVRKIQKRNQMVLDKINLEKNVNQSKLKAIKSQMNPHFFYNALNTLQSFILSNEKRLAIDYLSKFSNLTRTILEMTEKDFISIAEEIKTLQLYLDIEKGRFDEDFSYEIQTSKNVDQETIKIPTMLLQPYVENAVKHGLLHKQGNKKLTISFEIKNNELHIGIEDNGIGRQKSSELNQIKNKNHQSFATKALQNRIALLNEYNHKNISLKIIDKYNLQNQPTGTLVEIKIPINTL